MSIFLQYPVSQSDVDVIFATSAPLVIEKDFLYGDGISPHEIVNTGFTTHPVPSAQNPASKLPFAITESFQLSQVNS